MHDAFGNMMKRCVLPPGETSQLLSGVVKDADLPDARDGAAGDVGLYPNGSRYCGSDKLGSIARSTFGHLVPGTQMVQAICDFTHERLALRLQARVARG
jgi:hypothetical protein